MPDPQVPRQPGMIYQQRFSANRCRTHFILSEVSASRARSLLDLFLMRLLPSPHIFARLVEEPSVVIFRDLLRQLRAEFFPERSPDRVALLHVFPITGRALIAAIQKPVGILPHQVGRHF